MLCTVLKLSLGDSSNTIQNNFMGKYEKILRINMIKHLSYLEFLKTKNLYKTHWDRWLSSTDRDRGLKWQNHPLMLMGTISVVLLLVTASKDVKCDNNLDSFPIPCLLQNPFNPTIPTCIQMQDLVSSQQSLLFVIINLYTCQVQTTDSC